MKRAVTGQTVKKTPTKKNQAVQRQLCNSLLHNEGPRPGPGDEHRILRSGWLEGHIRQCFALPGAMVTSGMARIFITGSSTGLGLMAAQLLVAQGHRVVLHARNAKRAKDTRQALLQADAVVVGDVTSIAGAKHVADQANQLGRFDAVIHNVAVGYQEPRRIETEDGLAQVFAANTLAPYLLTALIERPARLVYLSSGLHRGAHANLDDVAWVKRPWNGGAAYWVSKLHDVLLAFGIARRWPGIFSNALEPGWVATRMGGAGAPDDLNQAHRTQAWLAVSNDAKAKVTAGYFYHLQRHDVNPEALSAPLQDRLFDLCEKLSGVKLA
jgi:NAD(P)-dependent dehydrogenase (short-subunit alcohol dehydrogenase family)